ncbi:hypothetical protein [Clostridium sp.]|uniref:hypothetical protein n=1 Tax=Clostridium sp. TaxID=1506 RepID=UPI002912B1A2|nr:hypothetical protein [Clostridium sp.]MDU3410053.1 hypothetical protein [Clostridium sp.]
MLDVNLVSQFGFEKVEKEEAKEFLIKIISQMGFTGVLKEIKGNRNSLKNALYAINQCCNDRLAKRYNVNSMEVVWQPSEERIKEVEIFRTTLIDLANYCLSHNTKTESEYLKLKNEYSNTMFEIAQLYKELDSLEDIEEYLNKSKEVELLQEKLNEAENKLDLYVMKNFK